MGLFTVDEELLPESRKPYRGKSVLKPPPSVETKRREPVYLVTDTSWWMEQGWRDAVEIARRVPEVFYVIPAGVMRELDGLKRDPEKGRRALESTKRIEELVSMGRARIETQPSRHYNALASKTDEEVVGVAERLKAKKGNVFLLTTDRAQIALAEQVGIKSKEIAIDKEIPFIVKLLLTIPIIPLLPIIWIVNKLTNNYHPNPASLKEDDDWVLDPAHPCSIYADED